MELEEMKNRWSSLEEQLKKQEIVNEKLIREIRQSKSGSLSVLINYSYFGLIVLTLALGLVLYVWMWIGSLYLLDIYRTILFAFILLFLIALIPNGIYSFRLLKKIDFTQCVSQNIKLVQTYKINYKRTTIAGYLGALIILILGIIAGLHTPNMEAWRWISIGIAIPIGVILGYLEYQKIYKKHTDAILKSLEELKELEE